MQAVPCQGEYPVAFVTPLKTTRVRCDSVIRVFESPKHLRARSRHLGSRAMADTKESYFQTEKTALLPNRTEQRPCRDALLHRHKQCIQPVSRYIYLASKTTYRRFKSNFIQTRRDYVAMDFHGQLQCCFICLRLEVGVKFVFEKRLTESEIVAPSERHQD